MKKRAYLCEVLKVAFEVDQVLLLLTISIVDVYPVFLDTAKEANKWIILPCWLKYLFYGGASVKRVTSVECKTLIALLLQAYT